MNGKSSTLLVVVIVALAVFGFAVKSFYDYQVTKLKLEHGIDPEAQASADPAGTGAPAAQPQPQPQPQPQGGSTAPAPAAGTGTGAAPAPSPAPAATVATTDPEIARMKAELDALRKENTLYQEKMDQARAATDAGTAATTAADSGSSAAATPDAEVQALRQQVAKAPAIGQVARCDWEFDLIWINGGTDRNLKAADKFAVRRGYEITGFITVEEVFETYAVTKLTSKNRDSETARKPEVGDDVIPWPLF